MSLTISIDFAASIARLEEQTKKSADAVASMADRVESAASFARNALIGLAGAISANSFASSIKNAVDFADSLNDLSIRTGATIETLAGLSWAAKLSDTSLESVATGARKLATGLVENREAFAALGIDTSNQTEALIQLGDVFAGMPDPVQRSALAVKVFGRSGEDMLPMLMEGSTRIREMITQGQQMSGVTTEMARQAAIFNDSLDELKLRASSVSVSIANQLLPTLNNLISSFEIGEKNANGFFDAIFTFGTINPFRTHGENIKAYGEELQTLRKARDDYLARGWSTAAFDADIADLEKKVKYLRDMQTRDALQGSGDNQSAAEAARLGLNGRKAAETAGQDLLKALSGAGAEMDKLRQKEIDGWVAYADAILAEGELIESMERERIIRENETQAGRELAWQQGVAQRLANLQLAAMSEAEIERGKLTAIQTDLQFARDQGWLTEVSYQQMLQQAQLEHEAKMGNIMAQGALARQRISQLSWMTQASMAASWLKNMTATAATSNKTMFELNKVAGISEAGINTYRAATGAYAALAPIPIIGPALGAAAAGIAIAAGMANVNAIKSAQFGSSTSPPSIAGGTATPVFNAGATTMMDAPTVPEGARPRQQMDITLVGDAFSYDNMVNVIIPKINEAAGNGVDIMVRRG